MIFFLILFSIYLHCVISNTHLYYYNYRRSATRRSHVRDQPITCVSEQATSFFSLFRLREYMPHVDEIHIARDVLTDEEIKGGSILNKILKVFNILQNCHS